MSGAFADKAETRTIRGTVVSGQAKVPIGDAIVRIEGSDSELQTTTSRRGSFTIPKAPSGVLRLVVTGSDIATTTYLVEKGDQSSIEIAVLSLGNSDYTITVIDSPLRPVTSSTSIIDAEDLATVPMRTGEDALRLVPGFTLVQHGSEGKGQQFFLRGFDAVHGSDIELTVEGLPVNEWSNIHAQGYLDLGFIIPEAIHSVEVIKGPFTLSQGAFAMAGSADYQLGLADRYRGRYASYTVGTTNRHRALVMYSDASGNGDSFLALEGLVDDGFGENRGVRRSNILTQVELISSASHGKLTLLASGYIADFELPGTVRNQDFINGSIGFYDSYDDDARGFSGRYLVGASYVRRTSGQRLTANAYAGYRRLTLMENFTGFLRDPINGDRRRQEQSTLHYGMSANYEVWLGGSFGAILGAGVRSDQFTQVQNHIDQSEANIAFERDLHGRQSLAHILLGVQWQIVEQLALSTGGRLDAAFITVNDNLAQGTSGGDTLLALSPRAILEWQASTTASVFAAYGRGFRPPEARAYSSFTPAQPGIGDEVFQGGQPAMTKADVAELGVKWRPSDDVTLTATGFLTYIGRETVFDHVSGVSIELNSTRRLGAEAAAQARITPWLTIQGDVTFVDGRFVESGDKLFFAPDVVGSVRANINHESGLQAGIRALGFTARRLPYGATGTPMISMDATIGYSWQQWQLTLGVENLINRKQREGEYHYASHWQPGQPASALPAIHYAAGAPLNARLTLALSF